MVEVILLVLVGRLQELYGFHDILVQQKGHSSAMMIHKMVVKVILLGHQQIGFQMVVLL